MIKIKAIFLDRDGVINDNKKHVNKPEDLIIYEAAKNGIKLLYNEGYMIFVVTNQGGIELGHLTHERLDRIHEKLVAELEPFCKITEIMYCPDFSRESDCRKPKPGMILELAEKYDIDLNNSWMIGDMETDIEAGNSAGCKTAKIGQKSENADINGKDLEEVAYKIVSYKA
ncbi:D-glycero-D-manno-heptose 1,7-bisphosphate phosphatase [Proteiniborus sp. DW1]|uniref:D-glycero-alpha-D-manno-heptose-1,7-bisphosphate 7-phosphatase n=1 Tax=Proteiniborus sp. DW1 TaxID=1889883 RepID=UPI00092DFBA5|nr:HAD-IIIA family hydrolase [Proteiniborus sp. DW1]SCG82286.1 D-glycero-D-manno-heptose 1,7-bisphosphate phosphatase [Proteiniborus sp. DW1]